MREWEGVGEWEWEECEGVESEWEQGVREVRGE